MNDVRWGIIGCGWVGRDLVAPAIDTSSGARLVALCDVDPSRLATAARTRPNVATHTELSELLADAAVEAVYVATPNQTHADVVIACARAGRHVLCEKPMATMADDAAAMLSACQAAGVRYATAFDQRYHAAHRRLRLLVHQGVLGVVTLAQVHYACWLGDAWSPWRDEPADNWRIDPDRAGGGALIDLAPHSIDLLPYVLGDDWVDLVALEQRCVHSYDVPDGAVLAGRLAGGALASISVSYNCPEQLPRRRLQLYGTAGMAEAVDTMGQTSGGQLSVFDAGDGCRRRIAIAPEDDRSPFVTQIEAFSRHVRHGLPLPVDPSIDVRHVALLEAAAERSQPAWR